MKARGERVIVAEQAASDRQRLEVVGARLARAALARERAAEPGLGRRHVELGSRRPSADRERFGQQGLLGGRADQVRRVARWLSGRAGRCGRRGLLRRLPQLAGFRVDPALVADDGLPVTELAASRSIRHLSSVLSCGRSFFSARLSSPPPEGMPSIAPRDVSRVSRVTSEMWVATP